MSKGVTPELTCSTKVMASGDSHKIYIEEANGSLDPENSQGQQRTGAANSIMKMHWEPWRYRFNPANATETETWFERNIKKKECVHFVSRPAPSDDREDVCHCGNDKRQHKYENRNHTELEWNPGTHIEEMPTNAFGKLKFRGLGNKKAKYVRASDSTPPEVLYEMMTDHWQLKKPKLLISVTGGARNVHMNPRLKDLFGQGLVKAARRTGAWIITGGCHAGVAKLVGEAVRDFSRSGRGYHEIVTIGIAPWGTVHNRDTLIKKEGGLPAEYGLYVANQGSLCCLDNNHSHFILVDDGTQGRYGVEIPLRTKLEPFISEQTVKKEGEDMKIPIVCVVLEGGPGTLDTIHRSMNNNTPCVIVAGPGDFADVIAQVAEMNPSEITVALMKKKLRNLFQGTMDKRQINECTKKIQDIVRLSHLLTIFREDKDSALDMDAAISQALLKVSQSPDHVGNENRAYQLQLDVLRNHLEIARSNTCKRSGKPEDLYPALTVALIENKLNFVQLFLEQGVSLQGYVTENTLIQLYDKIKPRTFWKLEKLKRNEEGVTLDNIEKALKSLLGNFPKLVESAINIQSQDTNDTKRQQSQKIKYPIQVLLIWAVVQNRGELAEILWTKCPDCIVGALTCSKILRARSNKDKNTDNKEEMKALADQFEERASGVFSECYKQNEERAEQLLTQKSLGWGDTTCMELATNAEAMIFMSNGGVQNYLNKIWWGKLSENNSFIRLLFCMVFFPLIFTDYITFRDEESDRLQRLHGFFNAPVVVFYYNAASYIGFLWLYAYILVIDFQTTPSWAEYLLYVWIISFVCEEVRQLFYDHEGRFVDQCKMYISEFWNQMDVVATIFFAAGIIFRWIENWPYVGRVILALDFIAFCLRLMYIFTLSRILGPKIIMLRRMTKDIFFFLFLLAVWVVSFGVSKQAIIVHNEQRWDWIFRNVLYQPYLQLFGQMITDVDKTNFDKNKCTPNGTDPALPKCPQIDDGNMRFPEALTIILYCLYLLFANILLLNLLIAMFSHTFSEVQENTDQIWKFQRHKLIKEYSNRPPAPPPFILLNLLYVLGKKAVQVISEKLDHDKQQSEHEVDDDATVGLLSWEKYMQEVYLHNQRKVHNQISHMIKSGTSNKVDELAKLLESKQKCASEVEQQVDFSLYDPPLYMAEKEGRETHNPWIQNPERRTGKKGLGSLLWYGPNPCLHPVLTHWKKNKDGSFVWKDSKKVLEVLAVKRDGWERWSLPGGILRPDEKLPAQLKAILKEESWEMFEALLEKGTEVYKGYLDDPRSTDDAWVEIHAVSVHFESPEDLKFLESNLRILESTYFIRWQMVDEKTPLFANMKGFLQKVAKDLDAHY